MMQSLPVLLYHYIRDGKNSIGVPPAVFEAHLAALRRSGHVGVGLDEAVSFAAQGTPLPKGAVLITFDDGFLDNYVNAWPLLEKYDCKGTIFAVTGRIAKEPLVRPTIEDVWRGGPADAVPPSWRMEPAWPGGPNERRDQFFSWDEARRMEHSGVVSVECHTHRHRSVFTGPGFEDFIRPRARSRSFDRIEGRIVFGLPAFPLGPAMDRPAFLPSERLYDLVLSLVPQEPAQAETFFADAASVARLRQAVERLPREELGRLEPPEEFEARVGRELARCAETLSSNLGRAPRALAWPWGKAAPESRRIAEQLGFKLLLTTAPGPNLPGRDAMAMHRFKARDKGPAWLLSRVAIYSRPWLARLYGSIRR